MKTKISVIVPIYNSEKYLDNCISSVLNQSYENFELILVNDGSTDKSLLICEKYRAMDYRIKVLDKENGGVSSARNLGIRKASGDYILFLDSDDWYDELFIESFILYLNKEFVDEKMLLVGGFKIVEKNKTTEIRYGENKEIEFDNIFEICNKPLLASPFNKLYSKKIIIENNLKFDLSTSFGEDFIFNLNYIKYIDKLYVLNSCYCNYRRFNEDTLSNKYIPDLFEKNIKIYRLFKEVLISKNVFNQFNRETFYIAYLGLLNKSIANVCSRKYPEKLFVKIKKIKKILNSDDFNDSIQYIDKIKEIRPEMKIILKAKFAFGYYLLNRFYVIYNRIKSFKIF